ARAERPFVPIHCGALPREVLESELFGHEKGAFTGAIASKPGLIDLADGGTLFLDEIGEMEPDSQVKLLRALETGMFFRVGSTRPHTVDVRIVAATNRDLTEAMKSGEFRQDLYYRINTITVTLPRPRSSPSIPRRSIARSTGTRSAPRSSARRPRECRARTRVRAKRPTPPGLARRVRDKSRSCHAGGVAPPLLSLRWLRPHHSK